jgi:hypothetical protein
LYDSWEFAPFARFGSWRFLEVGVFWKLASLGSWRRPSADAA